MIQCMIFKVFKSMLPNFNEEEKLWKRGFEFVVGLDEVGRGPLAGPAVAAAVFSRKNRRPDINVNDSKKLSEKKREALYEMLIGHPDIRWGIGIVGEQKIDEINILQATKLAMSLAVENLPADFLLLDGNFILDGLDISQKSIVKGDSKVFSIAAASIIAKVTRDRMMQKMHQTYPKYGFDKHKGYGTPLHLRNLREFGPCKIHRKSFYPVSSFLN